MASDSDGTSSDEGSAAPAHARSVASTGLGIGGLVVSYTLTKARKCLLCNGTSVDPTPLTQEDGLPDPEGRLPWRSYEKKPGEDGDTVRVPSGKLCLVCFNVYRALGSQAS